MTTKQHALEELRDLLKPGTKVLTKVNHVSRSGMMRAISAYVVKDGELFDLDWHIARAGIARFNSRHGGLTMSGCGMDMGFYLAYNISRALYPNGHKCNGSNGLTPTGKKSKRPRCNSNDHFNGVPLKAGINHRDGGYALRQEWI